MRLRKIRYIIILLLLLSVTNPVYSVSESKLIVAGSTTILPLSEKLAAQYKRELGVEVLVQGGGSSAGINALLNDVSHVAASSREFTDEEKKSLREFVIGKDVLSIVVNPQNPIENISMEELRDVLAGKITDWKKLGSPFNKQIQLVNDSAGSGTRAAMEELVMGKNKNKGLKGIPLTLMCVVANSSAEMKANVANSKYAIGYLPFNYLDDTVKTIAIDGIVPTYAAAHKGIYPLFRDLFYAVKKDSVGLGLAYIYYVLSPEGQDVVVREGFLPVKLITSVKELDRIEGVIEK